SATTCFRGSSGAGGRSTDVSWRAPSGGSTRPSCTGSCGHGSAVGRPETIGVVGLWHLGSVVAASWAELGHRVVGIERAARVVAQLGSGRAPIFEPELDSLIKANIDRGRLSFTSDLRVVADADVLFIAFDTPVDGEDRLELAELDATIHGAAPHLKDG